MRKCDVCGASYKNAHGVSIHKLRSDCGKNDSDAKPKPKTPPKRNRQGISGREAIRQILAESPQGLPVSDIFDQLKQRGLNLNSNYVSQAAASDNSVVRVGRGIYRLKASARITVQTGTAVVEETVAEATAPITLKDMPVEALVLRIETLESQNRAFHAAHLEIMKGILA